MGHRTTGVLLAIGLGFCLWAQPINAAEAAAIDPTKDCKTPIFVATQSDVTKALLNYTQYMNNDRYVLCFQLKSLDVNKPVTPVPLSQTLLLAGKDKPMVIYGLEVKPPPIGAAPQTFLSITGTNVTLQHVSLTGPGPTVAAAVGLKLSGTGHQVLASTIAGFDTGITADCAWPQGTIGSYGPSCTIGPKNTIGVSDPADTTGKKLVTIGVHVPATGQQVTVTQNTITTVLDKDSSTNPLLTDTKRIVLDKNANDNILPPPIIMEPKEASNLWVTLNAEQTIVTSMVGVLSAEGIVELFHEPQPPPIQFIKTCATLKKDADHYATLNIPTDTWLYVCDKLSLPYTPQDTVVSLVYAHEGNSAPYTMIDITDPSTLISPVGATMGEGGAVTGSPAGGSDVGSSGAGITTVAMADGPGSGPLEDTPAVGWSTPSSGDDTDAKPKAGAVAMDPGAIPEGGLSGGIGGGFAGSKGCSLTPASITGGYSDRVRGPTEGGWTRKWLESRGGNHGIVIVFAIMILFVWRMRRGLLR